MEVAATKVVWPEVPPFLHYHWPHTTQQHSKWNVIGGVGVHSSSVFTKLAYQASLSWPNQRRPKQVDCFFSICPFSFTSKLRCFLIRAIQRCKPIYLPEWSDSSDNPTCTQGQLEMRFPAIERIQMLCHLAKNKQKESSCSVGSRLTFHTWDYS